MLKKPKLILEIAKNHLGSVEKAKDFIRQAYDCKADAVKFQAYDLKDLIEEHPNADRYSKCHLPLARLKELKEYADDFGLDFWCSVFSRSIIKPLRTFTNTVKIPSTYFRNGLMVSDCLYHFNNIHISTGFNSTKYIENYIKQYDLLSGKKNVVYYLCTSLYPSPDDFLRLDRIKTLGLDGFSYHGKKIGAIINAWLVGADNIEIHFGDDTGSDFVWCKEDVLKLQEKIKQTLEMFKDKGITKPEEENFEFFRKEYKDLVCSN